MASHCGREEVDWSLVEGREEGALGVSEVEGLDWRLVWRGVRGCSFALWFSALSV